MGPDPDRILTALKRALHDNPGMRNRLWPSEQISKELVQQGYLEEEADPVLVAEMLEGLQSGKLDLPEDEEDGEETEEASPT